MATIRIFVEGDFTRWIITEGSAEYCDGGNYRNLRSTFVGALGALDILVMEGDRISVYDAQELCRMLGGDPRPDDADGFHWPYSPTIDEVIAALQRAELLPL